MQASQGAKGGRMMIAIVLWALFSSDRPGGQGGYDIYLIALPAPGPSMTGD